MIKAFYAVIVSAIAAGCVVAFPNLSQPVRANPPTPAAPMKQVAVAPVATCGENAWPYLDAACLRTEGALVHPREVRLIAAERSVQPTGR